MDLNSAIKVLKEKGSLHAQDSTGNCFDLVELTAWNQKSEGVFLIHDLFQIRNFAGKFSEVALDIVAYSPDKVIFHTPANPYLENGPNFNGIVKFALIKEGFWNKLLYQFSRQLVFSPEKGGPSDFRSEVRFPLFAENVKELFLGAEGEVKIIKG
ncbi:hypothetical protein [Negadavirga shengliensis]|uniref:Uncharacterized protein n=1 Tax=Negadavirga shengliensis TaxID=1389218 RepID=A0ABV9T0Y5_9BACT